MYILYIEYDSIMSRLRSAKAEASKMSVNYFTEKCVSIKKKYI